VVVAPYECAKMLLALKWLPSSANVSRTVLNARMSL
jgi:hypothetical protein